MYCLLNIVQVWYAMFSMRMHTEHTTTRHVHACLQPTMDSSMGIHTILGMNRMHASTTP